MTRAAAAAGGPPPFVPETAPPELGETKKTTLLKAINDALDITLVSAAQQLCCFLPLSSQRACLVGVS